MSNNTLEVNLRPITINDTENIVNWRNTDDVRLNLYSQDKITAKQHLEYLKMYVDTGKCIQFIIQVSSDSIVKDVGTIFIKNIDTVSRKAEIGIFIGDATVRGMGIAKKAIDKLFHFAFEEKQYHKLYLTLFSDNISAFRTYLSTGFRLEGVFHEEYYANGKYKDVIRMGVTKEEWMSACS